MPTPLHRPRTQRARKNGFGFWRAIQTTLSVAFVMATLFTLWTPANLFGVKSYNEYMAASQTTPEVIATSVSTDAPGTIRIGIISGHRGSYEDPGATCPPGFLPDDMQNEAQINLRIATLVQEKLMADGYQAVDLLDEFDSRLYEYKATVLISIHNDSCDYINDEATGFKVAASNVYEPQSEKAASLTTCLTDQYQTATSQDPRYPGGMYFHFNSITDDMRDYHAFREIDPSTPAAIIETGFLRLDRDILTQNTDLVAQGVEQGILCFLHEDNLTTTTP